MIKYDKRYWGLPLLLRLYGSAIPRTFPFVLLSATFTLVLELTVGHSANFEDESRALTWWKHPYPYQTFAFIVGFMLVFRSNFGYSRYWEGRTNLQLMASKWTDAAIQCLKFDSCTLPRDVTQEQLEASRLFQDNIIHLISLMHGVAMQNLRKDWNLRNLIKHSTDRGAPPADALEVIKEYKPKEWWLYLKSTSTLGSSEISRQEYCGLLPIQVIGGLTVDELEALGGAFLFLGECSMTKRLPNGMVVPGQTELAQIISGWIHELIVKRRREGGLAVEPPILTRVYQVISDGLQGYEQCRKIAETPFPFPWAQLVAACLLVYCFTVPIVISSYVTVPILAVILDIIAVATYYALNEVARDLEDPFVYDPNDLPVATYQYNFNERLIALRVTRRPKSPADAFHSRHTS